MGDKSERKAVLGKAGVPCVPARTSAARCPEKVAQDRQEIGYPIKAAAGRRTRHACRPH